MFTDNINPAIENGVETIGVNILLLKVLVHLSGPRLMMGENSAHRNWMMYSTLHTNQ